MKIALVAACDRNNYGDVLLPIIFEDYAGARLSEDLKKKIEIDYVALKKADLTQIGGKVTVSLNQLSEEYGAIILTGGEVLASEYFNMYMNLQKNPLVILIGKVVRRCSIAYRMGNIVCKKILKGRMSMPWFILPMNNKQMIMYNAVGGSYIHLLRKKSLNELGEIIEKSKYFTVRDQKTYNYIQKFFDGQKVPLLPDTAIIMSKLYYGEGLEKRISDNIKLLVENMSSYYVLQVNNRIGKDIVNDLAKAINVLYETQKVQCVLLPIGRAEGHDDVIPLKQIFDKTKENAAIFIEENNIYDVMYLIANSIGYAGTSLHGAITAMSYNKPHAALTAKAEKLIGFMDTWKTSSILHVDENSQLIDYIAKCKNENELVNKTAINNMQEMVMEYFDSIINDIINVDQF